MTCPSEVVFSTHQVETVTRAQSSDRLVVVAARPSNALDAEQLFGEQRTWLESLGIDIHEVQPGVAGDYEDAVGYYATRGTLLLAYLHDRPIGMVAVELMQGDPASAELRRTFVSDHARGIGAGAALVRAAIEAARALGASQVLLETLPKLMPSAAHVYEAAGFTPTDALGHTRIDGIQTMRLVLGV